MDNPTLSPEDRTTAMAEDLRRLADIVEHHPILEPLLRATLSRVHIFPEQHSVHSSAVTEVLRSEWIDIDVDITDPAFDADVASMPHNAVRVHIMRRRNTLTVVPA